MKIALNGRYSSRAKPTGMQRSAARLVAGLTRLPSGNEYVILGEQNSKIDSDLNAPFVSSLPVPWSKMGRVRAQLHEQVFLSRAARRQGCELMLNPIQTCPIFHSGLKQIVTVHDLNFFHHPEWFGRAFYWWNRVLTVRAIRRADHVVAISDYVLQDLRRTLGIPAQKSSRIYNIGPKAASCPFDPRRGARHTILCVNAFQPHKNLPRVLDAFLALTREFPGLALRIAGRPQENFAKTSGLKDLLRHPQVRLLGFLSDSQLAAEYANCSVFCFASLAEGFGLPVLEAAAAGAVTVTSTTTALPEIAGGSALLVDPHSTKEIAQALRRALQMSVDERAEWVARGQANLRRFEEATVTREYHRVFSTLANGPVHTEVARTAHRHARAVNI